MTDADKTSSSPESPPTLDLDFDTCRRFFRACGSMSIHWFASQDVDTQEALAQAAWTEKLVELATLAEILKKGPEAFGMAMKGVDGGAAGRVQIANSMMPQAMDHFSGAARR